jgi:hypothetical protein
MVIFCPSIAQNENDLTKIRLIGAAIQAANIAKLSIALKSRHCHPLMFVMLSKLPINSMM